MKLIILIFIFISNAYGALFINYSKSLPLEMHKVIESINSLSNNLTSQEQVVLKSQLQTMNKKLIHLKRSEIYFIIKTEIYKSIYEIIPEKSFQTDLLSIKKDRLDQKLNLLKIKNPFIVYIGNELHADYRILAQKKDPRAKLSTAWINFIVSSDIDIIHKKTISLILKIVRRINSKVIFYFNSGKHKKVFDELMSLTEKDSPVVEASIETTVEEITKKATEKKVEEFEIPLTDLFPEPNPNYVPPILIPEPAQSWDKF